MKNNGVRCTTFNDDLQKAANGVNKRLLEWNLLISKERTRVLHFGQSFVDRKFTIGDYELQQVEKISDTK